ncbi:MAG: hypothetical protein ACXWHZ_15770 [Usitatibacter sp.]
MTLGEIADIVVECSMGDRDWHFVVSKQNGDTTLHIVAHGTCTKTGKPMTWLGRRWIIEPTDTRDQIVQTALKAFLACVEHEAREEFTYCDEAIFGPHHDVNALYYLCAGRQA